MNNERPGSPSATTIAPASKRRSTSIETSRSRLASERPPKNGVASRNAFRSGELTAMEAIYSRSPRRQAGKPDGLIYDKWQRGDRTQPRLMAGAEIETGRMGFATLNPSYDCVAGFDRAASVRQDASR